ncbi:hypothetical protein CCACVL1_14764 [Corchorus capsularis]|uniref:Uncharacterized protein n=1 Tax=Corchorus capsularis TaxID=210143 RepID=A0A1R3I5H5_COCAP|nr:hypothetical protein CCACVL1_14764 [Corchorus capsularis]
MAKQPNKKGRRPYSKQMQLGLAGWGLVPSNLKQKYSQPLTKPQMATPISPGRQRSFCRTPLHAWRLKHANFVEIFNRGRSRGGRLRPPPSIDPVFVSLRAGGLGGITNKQASKAYSKVQAIPLEGDERFPENRASSRATRIMRFLAPPLSPTHHHTLSAPKISSVFPYDIFPSKSRPPLCLPPQSLTYTRFLRLRFVANG